MTKQARRLFALIAGGASFGGLTGPILGTLLVAPIGHAGLLFFGIAADGQRRRSDLAAPLARPPSSGRRAEGSGKC